MSSTIAFPSASQPSLAVPDKWYDLPPSGIWTAFRCLSGQSCISHLTLPPNSCNSYLTEESSYITAIHQQIQHFQAHESLFARLFGRHQLGFARVTYWLPSDRNAPCACCRVYLSDFEYHWLLTEIVLNPDRPAASAADIAEWNRLPIAPEIDFHPSEKTLALVVRRVVDKTKVLWLIGSLAILAPLTSILLGVCSHNTEAAIALFAGILALASFFQTLANSFPE